MPDPKVAILITAKDLASKAFTGVGKAGSSAGRLIADNWKPIAVGMAAAGVALEAIGRKVAVQNEALGKTALITGQTSKVLRQLAIDTANVTFPVQDAIDLFRLAGQQGLKSAKSLQTYATFWDTLGDAAGENAVELAKAGKGLKGLGIEVGKEQKAMKALGFILTKTTLTVKDFLRFVDRAGPELREMGFDANKTAAVIGVLTNELGMSSRVAQTEFTMAVSQSKGSLEEMFKILGITADQVEEYADKVEDSADAVQDFADIHADSKTVMQKVHHWVSELVTAHGELIQKATDLVPLLIGVATALTAIVTIGPTVKVALIAINKRMIVLAGSSKAAAIGIKSVKTALAVLAAFAVGWEIGTMLAKKFKFVRDAGIYMAYGLSRVWEWIKTGVEIAADFIGWAFGAAFVGVQKVINRMAIAVRDVALSLRDLHIISEKTFREMWDWATATIIPIEDMEQATSDLDAILGRSSERTKALKQSLKELLAEPMATTMADNADAVDDVTDATEDLEDETEDLEDKTKKLTKELGILEKSLLAVDDAFKNVGIASIESSNTTAMAMEKHIEKVEEAAIVTQQASERMQRYMEVAADGIFTSFEGMWTGLVAGEEAAHKVLLSGLANALAQMIKMYIFELAAIKIKEMAALGMEAFRQPWKLAGIAGVLAISAAATGGLKGIKFAEGGIVRRPTLGMVGEAGPEAIIPLNKFGGMAPVYNIKLVGPFIASPIEAREWARTLVRYIEEEQAR